MLKKVDCRGPTPESWACIDCGVNTAPGLFNRAQLEQAFASDWNGQPIPQEINDWSEVYTVKPAVWKAAGMTARDLVTAALDAAEKPGRKHPKGGAQ